MSNLIKSFRFWLTVAAILFMALLPLKASEYILGVLTLAYYFGVFAMGWDLLFGYAGEVNFGPTFLVGLGAYGSGMLNAYASLPMWVCIICGAAIAVAGGIALAVPALRLRGPYFGLVTLVAVLILLQVIVLFAGSTGGEIGLSVPDILSVSSNVNYYYALAFMVVSGTILYAVSRSSLGLILQATGQNPIAAQAMGFNVTKHKIFAFCLSAFFSGLAGALMIFYLGTASVNTVVDIAVAVQIIIAAVLGGRRTIIGGALGAIILIVAGEALRPIGQLSNFVVAAVALAVLLFIPSGLLGIVLRGRARQ